MSTSIEPTVIEGTIAEAIAKPSYIAVVGFEDIEDTIFVGIFNSQAEASDAADKAAGQIQNAIYDSYAPLAEPVPGVFSTADYMQTINARIEAVCPK